MPRYTVLCENDQEKGFSNYAKALRFAKTKGQRLGAVGIVNNKTGKFVKLM